MKCCHFYFVLSTLVVDFIPGGTAAHSDLRKELAAMRNALIGIDGKIEKMNALEEKVQDVESDVSTLISKVDDLNRKSLLLREIHQDQDSSKELLQRILRTVDDVSRKHSAATGRKHKSETEKIDKLSENIQALFQIFGSISRKLDDFQEKVERFANGCSLNDFKLIMTKKLDLVAGSTAALSECFECHKEQSMKDLFHSTLRHSLDNVSRKLQLCTTADIERSTTRVLEPKLARIMDSVHSDIHFRFRKIGHQLEGMKQDCKGLEDDVNSRSLRKSLGDMEYSQDTPHDAKRGSKHGDSDSQPRETPGRIFRKLWRKMTEPINKVGDKIESLGHMLEASHQRHHNRTVSKLLELSSQTDGTDTCSKQVKVLTDTAKNTVEKLDNIQSRQLTVHTMCTKILGELERVKGAPIITEEDDGIKITQSSKVGGTSIFNGSNREGFKVASSCAELMEQGILRSGAYTIKPKNATEEFLAFCDMDTDGGGWTVLQRRGDFGEMSQNFTQNWETYKRGFGDFQREFWLGNEKIHLLSTQDDVKLRVELEDFEDNFAYAEYSRFLVEDELHQYRLTVGEYKGNATDSLSLHDGKFFSTEDRDNDEVSSCCNCADTFKGGWWYYRCFEANLNGPYHKDPTENGYFLGIIWERWRGDYSLKSSAMKIRPLSFDEVQDP